MVRSIRTGALALAFLALPATAFAQGDKPLSFGVSGGLSVPVGDLSDGFSSGYNVTGHVFYKLASMPQLQLRGDVSFDRWGGKDDVFGSEAGDVSFRALGFTGNARYTLGSEAEGSMPFYVLGGLGFYNGKGTYDSDIPGVDEVSSESTTDLGINVGAGVDFKLSGFTTFLEARFVNVFSEGSSSSWIPITFGVRF